ncbi:MAG: ABC transporter permease [Verrucomicrobiota bacterium]
MKSPFSLFLALRYLKPKRTFVSVITLVSILGVTLGITVLILVISVMTGFDQELRKKVLGFDPHLLVMSNDVMRDWQPMMKQIRATPEVVAAAPFVQGPVIVEFHNQRIAPKIRGIDIAQEEKVVPELGKKFIKEGKFDLSGESTVIGIDLARGLGIRVGDKVTVYSPGNLGPVLEAIKKAEKDPKALEEVKDLVLPMELTVTGIFESGRFVYDSEFLLVPLHIGQELYGLDDALHGISVRTSDPNRAGAVKLAIEKVTPPGVYAQTWEDMNKSLFDAIGMERNVMFFLLLFIVIVAAFGIMNTLITVTVQKTREIGIMKALGASTGQIVWVFLGQGMIVGFFGNLTGLALGMTLIRYRNEFKDWLAQQLGIQVFPADIYQFSRIPAEVVPHDVAVICISAFVICSLAALIPAYAAARLDPVKALRQE